MNILLLRAWAGVVVGDNVAETEQKTSSEEDS